MPLPLHIIELRYKEIVAACLAGDHTFGVVQPQSGTVGCKAEIVSITKKYLDGRMDPLPVGREPFQVTEIFSDQLYLACSAQLLSDENEVPSAEEHARLISPYDACHTLIYGRTSDFLANSSTNLTYLVSSELHLTRASNNDFLRPGQTKGGTLCCCNTSWNGFQHCPAATRSATEGRTKWSRVAIKS